jgi:hypothetical protein
VGLEQGPLSLVRITEELLEWKSSGSGSRQTRITGVTTWYPLSAKVGSEIINSKINICRYTREIHLLWVNIRVKNWKFGC